jgi:hypothetical protein
VTRGEACQTEINPTACHGPGFWLFPVLSHPLDDFTGTRCFSSSSQFLFKATLKFGF